MNERRLVSDIGAAVRKILVTLVAAVMTLGLVGHPPAAQASPSGTMKKVQKTLKIKKVVRKRSALGLNTRVVKVKHPKKAGTKFYVITRDDYDDLEDTFDDLYPEKTGYCTFGFFDDYGDDGMEDWQLDDPYWDSSWDDSVVNVCPAKKAKDGYYEIVKNKKAKRYAKRALRRIGA
ncbi:hypothetical protein [Aeromicrobium sp.]|uniref:hypothetical protein n=1 Tax=Aeromicrobium sp. TaxID=1871063 RepID=UPI0028A703A1|nr:hypothetical protein [Aeromicrobium sp.]